MVNEDAWKTFGVRCAWEKASKRCGDLAKYMEETSNMHFQSAWEAQNWTVHEAMPQHYLLGFFCTCLGTSTMFAFERHSKRCSERLRAVSSEADAGRNQFTVSVFVRYDLSTRFLVAISLLMLNA